MIQIHDQGHIRKYKLILNKIYKMIKLNEI